MRTRLVMIAISVTSLVLILAAVAIAADPFVGTWKMNVAKSKSALTSFTMTIEAQGEEFKTVQNLIVEGRTTHRRWINKYDGKDYPVTGDSNVDMISVIKPDANTVEYVFKKNGEKVDSGQSVLSKDGKTMKDVGSQKDANGKPLNYTIIMEKQ